MCYTNQLSRLKESQAAHILYCRTVVFLILRQSCSSHKRSLPGNLDNSFPNPALKKPDSLLKGNIARKDTESQSNMEGVNGQGSSEYLPAYMLSNWSLERAGRGKRTMDSLACELRHVLFIVPTAASNYIYIESSSVLEVRSLQRVRAGITARMSGRLLFLLQSFVRLPACTSTCYMVNLSFRMFQVMNFIGVFFSFCLPLHA